MVELAVVEKQAMELSDVDRAVLAERLQVSLDPVDPELEAAWIVECEDRMAAYRSGEMESLDGPTVMAELLAKYKK